MQSDGFLDRLEQVWQLDDPVLACRALQELADEGCAEAMCQLANRCLDGNGCDYNPEKATSLFMQALLTAGYWEGLAKLWEDETILTPNQKKCLFLELAKAENAENPHRLFFMGLMQESLAMGLALQYYKKAAALNQPDALYRLGLYARECAADAKPEEHLLERAAQYFRHAADLGNEKAALSYVLCCAAGCTESRDYQKELYYLNQAPNEPLASYYLGYYHENGLGTKVDLKQAAFWYDDYICWDFSDMSAPKTPLGTLTELEGMENGEYLAEAYLALGRYTLSVASSERQAFAPTPLECFAQAAELAYRPETEREAQYECGMMHFFGVETKVDKEYGLSCIDRAADLGFQPAAEFLKEVAGWETIPQTLLDAGRADAQARREEALLRLSILERKGIDPEIRKAFAEKGIPGYASDDCHGFDSFTEEAVADYELIRKAVEDFERQGNTVYFIHGNLTMSYGLQESLFFVSPNPSQWVQERMDLLDEHPIVAVANLTEQFTEVGEIGYTIHDALMERRY